MAEETETVRSEIDEYLDKLKERRHDLLNFQTVLMKDNSVLAAEAGVIVTAIDSLTEKLNVPGLSDNVSLDTIVRLSDDVQNVMTVSTRLLSKRQPSRH